MDRCLLFMGMFLFWVFPKVAVLWQGGEICRKQWACRFIHSAVESQWVKNQWSSQLRDFQWVKSYGTSKQLLFLYKYNTSVDNTTLHLCTKIVYFVRATCFDLIRSSSGPPGRQIQELCSIALWDPKCLQLVNHLGSHNALWDPKCLTSCKHLGSHNAMEHNSWICLLGGPEDHLIRLKHVPWQTILFLCINKVLCYRLACCIYML